MTQAYFITGTDTGVGKTYVTTGLLKSLRQLGHSTLGIKPIASGAELIKGHLRNDDALKIQKTSTIQLPYDQINPFCFKQPIAPHIAANQSNIKLNSQDLSLHCQYALNTQADYLLIEGAGGWLTPLNHHQTFADWVQTIHANIIIVVGIRLGCLNHAQLTVQAIQATNLPICGWIANCLDKTVPDILEQIDSLTYLLNIPFLGRIHYNSSINLNITKHIITRT